jgi:hypothetical protein
MSADTLPSAYPDRPIRPLPKRRLLGKLSKEAANAIEYPPAPASTTPLFLYPFNQRDEDSESNPSRERATSQPWRTGVGAESDDEEINVRRDVLSRSAPDHAGHLSHTLPKQDNIKNAIPQAPVSAVSSTDGYYDPFELTNNKKKRKIPSTGDSAINGGHGLHDGMLGGDYDGTTTHSVEGYGDGSSPTASPYYGSGSIASGTQHISGPGRGRYGRVRNGRSPLGALSDSSNNWAGRSGKLRPSQWTPQTSKTALIFSRLIFPLILDWWWWKHRWCLLLHLRPLSVFS